jgi:exopolysaccharide biosynthesis polyprenyl glycosylphosphotransferase
MPEITSRKRQDEQDGSAAARRRKPGTPIADDGERELLPEEMFLRMLCLERKRAERSGRTFLLVLLEAEKLFGQSTSAVERVSSALSASTRETDFIGWHLEREAIGIVLTEIGTADRSGIRRAVLDTLTAALRNRLPAEQSEMIRISFYFFPDEQQGHHKSARSGDGKLYPDIQWAGKSRRVSRVIKRMIDIVGSIAALLVFSPILGAIAIAVKLTSKGPILFRQARVGQHGITFQFLKFRSMRPDSDPKVHREFINEFIRGSANAPQGQTGPKMFKITDDPRVTRVGKFIRKTSLDELPQFWNVLRGEMSLVGPRPPIPYELEAYRPWHKRRILEIKPGITGLWQIYGRSRTTFDEMVRLDLRYARTWSVLMDLKILIQTPRAMFSGEGAY